MFVSELNNRRITNCTTVVQPEKILSEPEVQPSFPEKRQISRFFGLKD